MLNKLLKYDLRSMFKTFAPIWLAVLAIALLNHFTLNGQGVSRLGSISIILPIIVYAGIVIAMVVLTLMYVIQRFYNGLLRDEGYLMFTLPVRPWQLVASKNLTATLAIVLSGLVGFVSVLLLLKWSVIVSFVKESVQVLFSAVEFSPFEMGLIFFEIFIIALIGIAGSIYRVYAAIALGHLFRNHRIGWAFAMYIAISVVLSLLANALRALIDYLSGHTDWLVQLRLAYASWNGRVIVQLTLLVVFLMAVLQVAVFHLITERILSKRLNLE